LRVNVSGAHGQDATLVHIRLIIEIETGDELLILVILYPLRTTIRIYQGLLFTVLIIEFLFCQFLLIFGLLEIWALDLEPLFGGGKVHT